MFLGQGLVAGQGSRQGGDGVYGMLDSALEVAKKEDREDKLMEMDEKMALVYDRPDDALVLAQKENCEGGIFARAAGGKKQTKRSSRPRRKRSAPLGRATHCRSLPALRQAEARRAHRHERSSRSLRTGRRAPQVL